MILAGSGHRPDKLGGYSAKVTEALNRFAVAQLELLQPTKIISGMALGWDQALATAAIVLNIPFVAAIPFLGQEKMWPEGSQAKYQSLVDKAAQIIVVSPGGFTTSKMQTRNQWMVDHCDTLLVLWNGTPGGTGNCVRYAVQKKVHMVNVWAAWNAATGD